MEEQKSKKPVYITISWMDCFKFWLAGFLFLLFLAILSSLLGWLG